MYENWMLVEMEQRLNAELFKKRQKEIARQQELERLLRQSTRNVSGGVWRKVYNLALPLAVALISIYALLAI